MVKAFLSLLLVALMLKAATSQTFQYSRGWTNGKRSYDSPVALAESKLLDLPARNFDLRTAEALSAFCCDVNCASKRVIKMLRNIEKAQVNKQYHYTLPYPRKKQYAKLYIRSLNNTSHILE